MCICMYFSPPCFLNLHFRPNAVHLWNTINCINCALSERMLFGLRADCTHVPLHRAELSSFAADIRPGQHASMACASILPLASRNPGKAVGFWYFSSPRRNTPETGRHLDVAIRMGAPLSLTPTPRYRTHWAEVVMEAVDGGILHLI